MQGLPAGSVVATLPLIVAFLTFQKNFIEGITAGSIKGQGAARAAI